MVLFFSAGIILSVFTSPAPPPDATVAWAILYAVVLLIGPGVALVMAFVELKNGKKYRRAQGPASRLSRMHIARGWAILAATVVLFVVAALRQ